MILGLVLIFGGLIGLLVIFGGGGSKLTLSQYFQQLEPLISELDDRSAAQVIDTPSQTFIVWSLNMSFTARDLRDIDPPGLVARAHRDLADAIQEGSLAMRALADQYPDLETLEEVDRLANEDETMRALDRRARTACAELLAVAEDNGFAIDLEYC